MSLLERVASLGDGLAVVDGHGAHHRATLSRRVAAAVGVLADAGFGSSRTPGARVAVLCRPGADWYAALFGAWSVGAVIVPLHHRHPEDELVYRLEDAEVSVVLCTEDLRSEAQALADRAGATVTTLPGSGAGAHDLVRIGGAGPLTDDALIVHTSGTTGRPKGVVHTHRSLAAQAAAMVEAWDWSADDRTLCVLPLDHVHGIVNATLTPLSVGATVEMTDGFEAGVVWERFASGELTVFTAVPTVYARLARAWEQADDSTRRRWSHGAAQLRLMISGSAALPVPVLEKWREISGHVLLERYGMTELGMVLGNTLDRRVPGHVGWPFPGVEVRADADTGELLVRGPQVFDRYWNRPEATAVAFDGEWFRTGDVAVDDGVDGWRLLGRASVDILKSGGEKVSALEIEATYRDHPAVDDCAVVGLPDDEWGQRVAMAWIATQSDVDADVIDAVDLRSWGKERLAAAKVPVEFLRVDDLPRNALGKVTKPAVADLFAASDDGGSPLR